MKVICVALLLALVSATGVALFQPSALARTGIKNRSLASATTFAAWQAGAACPLPGFALPSSGALPNLEINNVLGDLNGDGRVDLVTVSNDGQYLVTVALGNSIGSFDAQPSMPLGFQAFPTKTADFNRDGKQDLLFIDANSGKIYVRLGNGLGGFGVSIMASAATTVLPDTAVVADLNNDGNLDIVLGVDFVARVVVLLGDGAGGFNPPVTFTPAPIFAPAKALGVGDFNNDGKLDLIYLVDRSFQFLLLLGNGNGTFATGTPVSYLPPGIGGFVGPSDAVVGDVNGDGKLDVVVASSVDVTLVPGDGAGGFGQPTFLTRERAGARLLLGDFDGDGRTDIVATYGPEVALIRGLPGGALAVPVFFAITGDGFARKPSVADFNRDGLPDLFAAPSFSTPLGKGVGFTIVTGSRTAGLNAPSAQTINRPVALEALADFNGDGAADLLLAYNGSSYPDSGFALAFGNGSGSFGAPVLYPTGVVRRFVVQDFNNDGKPDLATNSTVEMRQEARIWLNQGGGTLASTQQITASRSSYDLAFADFNGDGKLDLVLNREGEASLRILAGDGQGMFRPLTEQVMIGFNFRYVSGDFDGDGKADLATWYPNNSNDQDEVIVLFGNGRGEFERRASVVFPRTGLTLAAADLNGDGRSDLISTRSTRSNDSNAGLYVALASTNGSFATPVGYQFGEGSSLALADVNGDGRLDLLAGVFLYLNRGDGSFSGPARLNAPSSPVVGDVNRDGIIDLVIMFGQVTTSTLYFIPGINLCSASTQVTAVSAASYNGDGLAAESIAALFGSGLAGQTQTATSVPLPSALAGAGVKLRDSAGIDWFTPLFFVAPGQINLQIPPGVALGTAVLTALKADGGTATGMLNITKVSPGIFSANASGTGLAAALALRIKADGAQSFEPTVAFDAAQGRFVALPIDLGPANDQVFLILFGTGIRGRSALEMVTAQVGGVDAPVLYAGAQGALIGLDQINLRLPRSLAGREEVDVALIVDGKAANRVSIGLK